MKENQKVQIGEIVLMGDDLTRKRINWPLSSVVNAMRGKVDNIRLHLIKTKNVIISCIIQRLYPLEINRNDKDCVYNKVILEKKYNKQNKIKKLVNHQVILKSKINSRKDLEVLKTRSRRVVYNAF